MSSSNVGSKNEGFRNNPHTGDVQFKQDEAKVTVSAKGARYEMLIPASMSRVYDRTGNQK